MRSIVAIVGRPNVGKSTLFNRLIREQRAIVLDTPGVTRDRHYGEATHEGVTYTLVDTGGFEPEAESGVLSQMRKQAMFAIEEADVVGCLLDVRDGLLPADEEIADMLRRSGKPVVYAVNKCDGPKTSEASVDFYALGVDRVIPISSAHGRGIGELLDAVLVHLSADDEAVDDDWGTRVAFVGRPNVGKSTMTNRLLGEDRMIVDDQPGTTRDAIDVRIDVSGRRYVLVDTAGLRRSRGIDRASSEGLSVIRTLRAVERCNIAVLLLDSTEGLTDQDVRIAGLCDEKGRGLIIVANKWDVVEKDAKSADRLREQIALKMPFVAYAPVLFLSGMTGLRMPKLLDQIDRVRAAQTLRVGTGQLNRWLEDCVARHQPPVNGVRRLRLYYGTQVGVAPPTIVLSCNNTEAVHLSYKRYLCNQFREVFDVPGTPVRLIFRARGESPASSGDDEEERETED